ncbi:MAG: hypothetical protein JXB23_08550 [Candidatus Aminicenantes bacterium]|nr:hypothetical protein [Candidatus Aminicenantes bacterium]
MLKKPQFLSALIVVILAALISIAATSDDQAGIQSKKSHAEKLWKTSGHADKTAEAFMHWDEDGAVESDCAKCHSTPGYVEFLQTGTTGSQPIGTTVECQVCHSDPDRGILRDHTEVTFPSGITIEGLGPEALCMECHQGRESGKSVEEGITAAGIPSDDTPSDELGFINIHYYAAAADQFGTFVKGGYEYDGKSYDARFSHVTGYNACQTCHNPHSLEVELHACNTCHTGIKDPKNIRYYGSFVDYDGDGDTSEGIFYEIEDLKSKLYFTIQRYAKRIGGNPIVYDPATYPYFFNDNNDNGAIDADEANYGNQYKAFTPRLLRAAYNYQVSLKDPNAFAHGGKYIIELLYDSIEDLSTKLNNPSLLASLHRTDEGHFDGSSEAFRHWDVEVPQEVESDCVKCHSAVGLQQIQEMGENTATEVSNGMLCTTCHSSPPSIRQFGAVEFPSGAIEDMGDSSNLCLNCHQGRASRKTVAQEIADNPAGPFSFINIHYYPTAAVLFGSEVHGGFEFQGKHYAGQKLWYNHNGRFDTCVECHMGTRSENKPFDYTGQMHNVHTPDPRDCVYCHGQDIAQPIPGADPAKFSFEGIRPATTPDYDGDGNKSESIKDEINGLENTLYAKIQSYAAAVIGIPIVYDSQAYPYFFMDKNENGAVDPGEAIYPNAYNMFNAKLLRAAYNYQLSLKEPNNFIHNSKYVAQLLVDSIAHLGGDVSMYKWRK